MTIQTAVETYVVRRNYWAGCGRHGCLGLHVEGHDRIGYSAPPVEQILGRPLAPGARVRVTIEVLDEGGPFVDSPLTPPAGLTWDQYDAYVAWYRAERLAGRDHGYRGPSVYLAAMGWTTWRDDPTLTIEMKG